MRQTSVTRFKSVCEWNDPFLSLFPHRFDYIFAPYPNSGEATAWKTESRHPLSDRLVYQGAYLYGVRFGAETNYCLLDIDTNSTYHPKHDPFAISRIAAALEPLGLVRHITCTSSYSSGLHLYFPFQQTQSSWQLAIALACLLENAGFKLQPGQLEIFPNPKPYSTDSTPSLFNAHRLPLQIGSYLLDQAFQPIWSDSHTFVTQWKLAQQQNDIDNKTLKQILKQAKRKHFGISGKAEKFVNDLNAEIELGWTGSGQTNRLLGRITMRAYIFHHILSGGEPLKGEALVSEIVEIARSLPGYSEWCQHQHEIEHRGEEWARCIENSHYFHFGDQSKKTKLEPPDPDLTAAIDQSPSWNQRQSAATRDRIRRAIADLLEKNSLPVRATARFQALLKFGVGGASLYVHRGLWHPSYFCIDSNQDVADRFKSPVENPPNPPDSNTGSQLDCVLNASNWLSPPSLLVEDASNALPDRDLSNLREENQSAIGSNASLSRSSSDLDKALDTSDNGNCDTQPLQPPLFNLQTWFDVGKEASQSAHQQVDQIHLEAKQAAPIARMQHFLESGDPILMAEALAWSAINPGVLQVERMSLPLIEALELDDSARDLSGVLAAISVHIQRLELTREQVGDRLSHLFGKCSQTLLDDMELAQWNLWLEEQSDPRSHEPGKPQ